jgi:DNA (cytosine-5)-methyltransferase 1
MKKVLNLYSGLGGNRKLWENCEVTAVEWSPEIAAVYQRLHPKDQVVVGDAHKYLLEHYQEFDFIWTSPPCQTHSKMAKFTRHKLKRYPDLRLYEEIIFLQNYCKVPFVVENVVPYYTPLIQPTQQIGRHIFWSNFKFEVEDVERPKNFINQCNLAGKKAMQEWLGIHYEENIYYGDNHCPAQILRNCVHPKIGQAIFNQAIKSC